MTKRLLYVSPKLICNTYIPKYKCSFSHQFTASSFSTYYRPVFQPQSFALFWHASHLPNQNYSIVPSKRLLIAMDIHSIPGPEPNSSSNSSMWSSSDSVPPGLSLAHLNVRSFRSKFDEVSNLLSDFHIICLCETHLDANVLTESILIPGFEKPFRRDCAYDSRGLLIYAATGILAKRRFDLETVSEETMCRVRN